MNKQRKPLAYDAYQELAHHYAAMIDRKPHNAYYDRPAMIKHWPELKGLNCLDAGCGPGEYTGLLLDRGATVIAVDVSDKMLAIAREKHGERAEFRLMDLSADRLAFESSHFHFINAALCFDYIENWDSLLKECFRILKPNGLIQISCGHPAFDAEYYKTKRYFTVEQVECTWRGFGKEVVMPSYRRSLEEIIQPFIRQGFQITKVVEPLPTDEFRKADPIRYESLMHRPSFLLLQARRP